MNKIKNFKNFLYLCWKHLNLPDPTPIQYDIADYLQSDDKRLVIEDFRGVGKSWITINGFSINFDCELENFNKIVPCGIENCLMTNMTDHNKNITIQEVKKIVKKIIQEEFNFDFVPK